MAPPIQTSIPLLGRAGVFTQRKIFQFFAQIRDINLILQTPDRNFFPQGWMSNYLPQSEGECGDGLAPRRHKCERLWRLGTGCQVAYRSGAGPFSPLSTTQLDAFDNPEAPDPPGAASGGSGYFRVQYTITTLTGKKIFYLDVGETVETYALQVNANIVGPPGSIEITDRNSTPPTAPQLTGLVVDARIGAVFEPIEAPTGLREGLYTQFIPVVAGLPVAVPIPKFARAVNIFQDALGAGSGPWTRNVGPPVAGLDVGQIAFIGRSSREVDSKIGRESSLLTDVNLINARLFQVVWTIRP